MESDNAFHKQHALRTVAGASGVTINLRDMSALSEREERACAAENLLNLRSLVGPREKEQLIPYRSSEPSKRIIVEVHFIERY